MNFEIPNEVKNEYIKLIKREECNYDLLLRYCLYIIYYERNENLLNMAYEIIVQYTIVTKDYEPINEISMILGFAPIINILKKKGYKNKRIFENIIEEFYLRDNLYKGKILSSGQKIIYKLINFEEDYSIVAPTSYGKTELMIESALKCDGDVIIIVPLVALLNQVKNDVIRTANENKINVKVITHHDIKPSDTLKNIYVITQERCYQLIKKNKIEKIKELYIDESHNLLNNSQRSFKLSEIIYILKRIYKLTVRYYSPVISDPESIIIKGLYNNKVKIVNKIRDLKVYRYFIYNKGIKKIYIPGSGVMTEKCNMEKYNDEMDYIIHNSKNKNIIFLNSPKDIEKFALDLANKVVENNKKGIKEITDFVGDKYYILDTLKKGIIYIHSQMPDIVKQYLIQLYREEKSIKYIITNSSILEGVNTPSDNLFIVDYLIGNNTMRPIEFINLKGRINRISEIIKEKNLSKLICEVHFIADTDYKRRKVINEIINPCYSNIKDKIENPYLEKYQGNYKENDRFIESINKVNLIDESSEVLETFDIELPEKESEIKKICLLNDIILDKEQEKDIENRIKKYADKKIENTYELVKCINEIFNLKYNSETVINRLSYEKAQKFYGMLYNWLINSKTLKEKANKIYHYYKNTENELIYIGSRGDISAELENGKLVQKKWSSKYKDKKGQPIKLKDVWISKNKPEKELYNLAIIKIKIEEDFISLYINPYVETLYQMNQNIISDKLYKLIKYNTDDEFEIKLIKEGMSPYLAKQLNKEEYKIYIKFKEYMLELDKKLLEVFNGDEVLKYELNTFIV